MLFLLTGSAASGKSAALAELASRHTKLVALDLDDLRPPPDADATWWREQIESHVLRALTEQAAGRDTVLAGWTRIDDVRAVPAAAGLDGIVSCLLDCDDDVRLERIERRTASGTWGAPPGREQIDGFLRAAAEMRTAATEDVFRLETSRLSVGQVADVLEQWIVAARERCAGAQG